MVTAKTRTLCYVGSFQDATMHILRGRDAENIIPDVSQSYSSLNKTRTLSSYKMEHLKQMYQSKLHSSWASPNINFVIIILASSLVLICAVIAPLYCLYTLTFMSNIAIVVKNEQIVVKNEFFWFYKGKQWVPLTEWWKQND